MEDADEEKKEEAPDALDDGRRLRQALKPISIAPTSFVAPTEIWRRCAMTVTSRC